MPPDLLKRFLSYPAGTIIGTPGVDPAERGVAMLIVDKPRYAQRERPPEGRDPAPAPAATEAAQPGEATWLWMFGPLDDLG